jgi:hypothetical protein
MVVETLIPSVQDRENAEEESFSRGYIEDGLGGCGEEGVERMDSSRAQEERAERRGNREDEVEIAERQQVLLLSLRPDRLIEPPTTRTVTVSAGVEGEVFLTAPVANEGMASEATGTARQDVSRGLALFGRQTQGGHVIAQHVGDTDCGALAARHDYSGFGLGSSSGLFTSPSQFLARRT